MSRVTTLIVMSLLGLGGASISGAAVSAPIHQTCPKSAQHTARTHNARAASEMVAPGADSVLLCRYHGLNPSARRGRLEYVGRVTSRATIDFLVRHFNALQPLKPEPGTPDVMTCRADFGSRLVAYFHYGVSGEWTVVAGLTGCKPVSNGQIARWGDRSPASKRLFDRLYRLTNFSYGPDS